MPAAKKCFCGIFTADLKDLHVEDARWTFFPFLELLVQKLREGVEVRLVHAKEPGPRFREEFDRYEEFIESDLFERLLCPRMHMKLVVADGQIAYVGSLANLTQAPAWAPRAKAGGTLKRVSWLKKRR